MTTELKCPECGEPIWDFASGSKLNKCWNSEGHADGGPLAFDSDEGEATSSCVRCNSKLPPRRRKYCSDRCAFWYRQSKTDKPRKFSLAQHLRMQRAGRAQAKGRVGCRFN